MNTPRDAFYVGYEPRMPAPLARFLRPRLMLLLVGVALAAVALAASLPTARGGRWEYGVVREYEGRLIAAPHPILAMPRADGGWTHLLLVARGKRGADGLVAGLDGAVVRVRGSLIERDGSTMLELEAPAVRAARDDVAALPAVLDLGERALVGEIVDGKCHLGAMVPGEGRAHRGCAVRCISGGAPPLLVAQDEAGHALRLLLVDHDGGPVGSRVLPLVAQPVRIRGRVTRRGDLLFLAADPSTYERIP